MIRGKENQNTKKKSSKYDSCGMKKRKRTYPIHDG